MARQRNFVSKFPCSESEKKIKQNKTTITTKTGMVSHTCNPSTEEAGLMNV